MGFKAEFKKTIRTRFISGVLVIVPLFVAVAVLKSAAEAIDDFISPYLAKIIGQDFAYPYLGLAITILLITLTGILTTNVVGQRILKRWEKLILKIPFFNILYAAPKKLIEGLAIPDKKNFEKVVMIEFPGKGLYALGFLANRIDLQEPGGIREFWSIFVPSTPTPFSGIVILVPAGNATILDMTVEEGISFFVSGSVAIQGKLTELIQNNDYSGKEKLESLASNC